MIVKGYLRKKASNIPSLFFPFFYLKQSRQKGGAKTKLQWHYSQEDGGMSLMLKMHLE